MRTTVSVTFVAWSVCVWLRGPTVFVLPGSPVAVRAGAYTWLMTAVSCPTALGALCGQLTFRLAWCREHSACSHGQRTFAAARPRLWNSLPVQLRNPDITYGLFRWQLNGHLCWEAWTRRFVTSDVRRNRKKTLTYLLTNIQAQRPRHAVCNDRHAWHAG